MMLKSLPYAVHPRPNPIAAALYTLRDLNCTHIILHGPAGCNFRALRLLEQDGVMIFTTAMSDMDIIMGGKQKLMEVLRAVYEDYKPELIGVIGTCCTTIIGENIEEGVKEADVPSKVVSANITGCGDNTEGAIRVLEAAFRAGLIDSKELERQVEILRKASEVEKQRGVAVSGYVKPSKGDDPKDVAAEILRRLEKGIVFVLNAKKETAYMYSDIILALKEAQNEIGGEVRIVANLDYSKGLPKVRADAKNIITELEKSGIKIDYVSGALDEYACTGERVQKVVREMGFENVIVAGVPQAVISEGFGFAVGVSSGERTMTRLREIGYDMVVNEESAHVHVLGRRKIVRSSLGEAIRSVIR